MPDGCVNDVVCGGFPWGLVADQEGSGRLRVAPCSRVIPFWARTGLNSWRVESLSQQGALAAILCCCANMGEPWWKFGVGYGLGPLRYDGTEGSWIWLSELQDGAALINGASYKPPSPAVYEYSFEAAVTGVRAAEKDGDEKTGDAAPEETCEGVLKWLRDGD